MSGNFAPVDGYCTLGDLQVAIPDMRMAELTGDAVIDPAHPEDAIDLTQLSKVVFQVSRLMDRYLTGEAALPVRDAGGLAMLSPACVDIVKYRLLGRRDLDSKDDPNRVQYDRTMKWLESRPSIRVGSAEPIPTNEGTAEYFLTEPKVFWGPPL